MSSFCEACGAEVNCWWSRIESGVSGQRCDDCHTKNAPIADEHRGKRSRMDMLPMAVKVLPTVVKPRESGR